MVSKRDLLPTTPDDENACLGTQPRNRLPMKELTLEFARQHVCENEITLS